MKIALLTFHWAIHEGAFLQTFALYQVLRRHHNADVTVVNYLPPLALISEPTADIKKLIMKHKLINNNKFTSVLLKVCGGLALHTLFNPHIERKKKAYQACLRLLNLTEPITNIDELRKIIDMFDVIVVGSDQVWNPQFLKYSNYAYTLPFKAGNVRKVAFSASLGIDNLTYISSDIMKLFRTYLRDFAFISLRERSHIPFLSKIIGKKIYHTLDPTLLIDKRTWQKFASLYRDPIFNKDREYILVYVLDLGTFINELPLIKHFASYEREYTIYVASRVNPASFKEAIEIARFVISLRHTKHLKKLKFVGYIDPFEFLALIKNAKYIITNSYHGTIFSIIFEKSFIALPRHGVSVRILDLLDLLNLRDKFVYIESKYEALQKLLKDTDFANVNYILKFYRSYSLELLKFALSDEMEAIHS